VNLYALAKKQQKDISDFVVVLRWGEEGYFNKRNRRCSKLSQENTCG
jgi:hypothetical protein